MMKNPYIFGAVLTFSFFLTAVDSWANSPTYLAVGKAQARKSVLAYPETAHRSADRALIEASRTIRKTLTDNLTFMDLFSFLAPAAFIEKSDKAGALTPDQFQFSDWTAIGTDFLIKSALSIQGRSITLEGYLYDVRGAKTLVAKKYVANASDAQTLAHTFGNDIMEALTGQPGIFLTKIALSCDRTKKKEIYVMNFDGTDIKQITHHRSTAFAPAWHPDGTKLAYSVYTRRVRTGIRNLDLYEFDFRNNGTRMISNRKGMNSGASYSPDGKRIALTMSFLGHPEIFSLDPEDRTVTRLTNSVGIDVDPSWSPDGRELTFVSSRSGRPMVYRAGADGSNPKRLTYAGTYNATPSWSPRGDKIVFAGWLDGRFDIFLMNPDGTKIERLTKNQGSNEDPHFSPDGNFIVFSSNRTGTRNIYMMNVDGTFVKRLTYGLGNCNTPRWSNPPRS